VAGTSCPERYVEDATGRLSITHVPDYTRKKWCEYLMRLQLPDGTIHDAGTDPKTAASLLAGFGINPLEVIVTRNGKLIPEDATVSGNDEVRVFLVAHGG